MDNILYLDDKHLNNDKVLCIEQDQDFGGLCGNAMGILYEESLGNLFEHSGIEVYHFIDGMIELKQFDKTYVVDTFIFGDNRYESEYIDFDTVRQYKRTGDLNSGDYTTDLSRVIRRLEDEFEGYRFNFNISTDNYLSLHYDRHDFDDPIYKDVLNILREEFVDLSYVSVSSRVHLKDSKYIRKDDVK